MKTAMQELIDKLKSKGGGMEIYINANTEIINESLEKEKEQIRISYGQGRADSFSMPSKFSSGKDYYKKTYQNK